MLTRYEKLINSLILRRCTAREKCLSHGKLAATLRGRWSARGPVGLEICGEGVPAAALVGWCLGAWVSRWTAKAAAVPSFPDQSRRRRWTAKAGARSFIPGSIQAAKVDGEGRRPFLHSLVA